MLEFLNTTHTSIMKAAQALTNGGVVAFPTETVYGLGVDANNKNSVSRMYLIKGRPLSHPVIVHLSDKKFLHYWARDIPEYAHLLADKFWPGPMTLVLPRNSNCGLYLTGGQDNVGIRIPSHPVALNLLNKFEELGGKGVAAPSANRFGSISPTSAQDVYVEFVDTLSLIDLIIDGGRCEVGIESTVIDCTGVLPKVLRYGVITPKMIQGFLKMYSVSYDMSTKLKFSGSFKSHYAPKAKLILSKNAKIGDGFIALHTYPTPIGAVRLAAPKNLQEYAFNLYSALREGDSRGIKTIYAIPAKGEGIAQAINDRLLKAAGGLN